MTLDMKKNLLDLEQSVMNSNLNEDIYKSNDFYVVRLAFSLLESMEVIVKEAESENSGLHINDKASWMKFLSLYYNRLNISRNLFYSVIKGERISDSDRDELITSIEWVFDVLENVFVERKNEPVYFINIILAGKFYNYLFYKLTAIEVAYKKKLNLTSEYIEGRRNLSMIINEWDFIDEIEKQIKVDSSNNIPEKEQSILFGMWDRTLDFIAKEIPKERKVLEKISAK